MRVGLLFQEFQDLSKELLAVLFEQHEMRGILDQHVMLRWRVDQGTHQTFAVFLERPGIEVAADHERRSIDVGGVPKRTAGRLVEGILQPAVRSAQEDSFYQATG